MGMSPDASEAIPISPPFWCSQTQKYGVRVDYGSEEYILRWTDSARQPDLSRFLEIGPEISLEHIAHSEEEDKIWASSVPHAFGSHAHVRRSKASKTEYPMYKIAHRTHTSIRFINNELQVLQELHPSDLPIVKIGAHALVDDSGVFGFTMEELIPISPEDIPLYLKDMERILRRIHHESRTVHTDVSISNFMVNAKRQLRLIDFGQAGKLGDVLPEHHPLRRYGFESFEIAMDAKGMDRIKERAGLS